jgi:broad specificity phosphatase PhoE
MVRVVRKQYDLAFMTTRTILTLVRHGETSANVDGVWNGSLDTPLNARGHAQASRVARFLETEVPDAIAVFSSPLQRARITAEKIADALNQSVQTDPELTEFHLGAWEGKSFSELMNVHRLWHHMHNDPDFAPHGGESPRQVADRYARALRRIGRRVSTRRAVVVGHGGAFSMAMALLLDGDYGRWRPLMSNCGVSHLSIEPEISLLDFDHTDHLDGL